MKDTSDSDDLSDSNEAVMFKQRKEQFKKQQLPFHSETETTTTAEDVIMPEDLEGGNYNVSTASSSSDIIPFVAESQVQASISQIRCADRSRVQRFSSKWLSDPKLRGWIQAAEDDTTCAKCSACVVKLKAKHSDLVNHANSLKHKRAVIKSKGSRKVDILYKTVQNEEHNDVICATLRSALLVVEHNLSFSVIDHLCLVNKMNFKDSNIAQSLQLGRTKCSMIIQNVLAGVIKEELKKEVQNKKVSVLLDEATDISNKKLLCILVKYIHGNAVKTQVLGLKEVDSNHGIARGLYTLLEQSLIEFNIEARNVVGYCADNASVMMGSKESVKQYLLNANPHLISNGCICHTIHLIAVSAAGCLPEKLENFLHNISTYFSRSPKRQSVLETFQEYMQNEKLKILKPSSTRWLALFKCIDRILEEWDVLTELFRLADFERESEIAKIIYNELCNPVTKAYMLFLKYILPVFNQFNAFFQSESLLTPFIYSECLRFLKILATNFLKIEYISDEIVSVNCLHPQCILPVESIQVGSSTFNLISSFDKNLKEQFLFKCLAFYQKAFQECLNRFPMNNFFKNLNFIQINNALNIAVNTDIHSVAEKICPNIVDNCKRECSKLKIYFSEEEKSTLPKTPIEFWKHLSTLKNFNDEFIFKNIAELALIILCIPHGNADVERIFSNITDIKTKKRNKLSTSMLEAVLRIKVDLHDKKLSCHDFVFTKQHFERYNVKMYSGKA